ncbi:MAG: hypothetical protein BECKG1743D_GA0114223_109902 [Candidatus Kentron sp. G]|nr:MAG: hypothetical protein BECKG1743F_GA0114225_111291 [Candidatus Kentron sp. G]VFN07139.1 MAG: hypothetical protein BECKG1743D_GA0114223_109902 [Candidatus Kentron sp. G]VFN07371.1 MAG: hypothetical protein BECKG1743E_GA0114224_111961 [Candidatus Kentron sp. G]
MQHIVLSPHAREGLFFGAQGITLFDESGAESPITPSTANAWLASHEEVRWDEADGIDQALSQLSIYSRRQESLDLALIVLDDTLPLDLRAEGEEELDGLLSGQDGPEIGRWLSALFHLRPLPAGADLAGALDQARGPRRARVKEFLQPLAVHGETIARSWGAWRALPDDLFEPAGGKQIFMEQALERGAFTFVVCELSAGEIGKARFCAFQHLSPLSGHREVVNAWLRPFSDPVHKKGSMGIEEVPATRPGPANRHGKKKGRRQSIDRQKILHKVETQKSHIGEMMQKHRLHRIPQLIEELVTYHHEYGGGEYAAKSLLRLALFRG